MQNWIVLSLFGTKLDNSLLFRKLLILGKNTQLLLLFTPLPHSTSTTFFFLDAVLLYFILFTQKFPFTTTVTFTTAGGGPVCNCSSCAFALDQLDGEPLP
jgi:hypothetical protein